jgi:hypothetical protein
MISRGPGVIALVAAASLLVPALPGPARAQDYATTIDRRSEPLDNHVRIRIVEEDLTPRAYFLRVPYRTRVRDNHADVVARRAGLSFDERFARSAEARRELFDLYDRLSR